MARTNEATEREHNFSDLCKALAEETTVIGEPLDMWTWRYADGDVCEKCEDTFFRPDAMFSDAGGTGDLCFACAAQYLRNAKAENADSERAS